ncbi:MAG: SDR family oxidoreductase [Gammaproteobacteria bacterium]|nr:SDR family oxidoreductase [Gammaproteobacteria bacterium]
MNEEVAAAKTESTLKDPTELWSLTGRTIIVTGAAQGIGQGTAQLAYNLGASIVAVDANGAALAEWTGALDRNRVLTLTGSVTDQAFAERCVGDARARFGDVDGLVNNAGIVRAAMIEKMSAEKWQAVIDVNLTGSFYFLQAVGRHLIAQVKAGQPTRGAIVNVSSDAGRRGTVGQINYGAAKSGMLGLTMSAAREWGRYGVRVNSVCFGVVETPMTETIRGEKFRDGLLDLIPMKRFSTIAEAAPPICFLLSAAASYVTGQHLSINGGYHIGF